MPNLEQTHFSGETDSLTEAELRRIEVSNFAEDVDKVLKHSFKWKGKYK